MSNDSRHILIIFCMGSIVRDFFIWKWYEFCVIILHIGHFHSYLLSTELVGFLTVFLRCCVLLLCFIQLRCLRDVLFFFFFLELFFGGSFSICFSEELHN